MLQERITTALHLPPFAQKADSEQEYSAPEGEDCTCFFQRDWEGYGFPKECVSSLIGVFVANADGSITAYTRDDAYSAFGVPWVRHVESLDAQDAEGWS